LTGFDISAFIDAASAQFRLSYHDATDGREQFFLASADGGGGGEQPVPEPFGVLLLGAGLLGFAASRKLTSTNAR
jgi:hypothetical protein